MRKYLWRLALGLPALLGAVVALSGLANAEAASSPTQTNSNSNTTKVEVNQAATTTESNGLDIKQSSNETKVDGQTGDNQNLKESASDQTNVTNNVDEASKEPVDQAAASTDLSSQDQVSTEPQLTKTEPARSPASPEAPLTNLNQRLQTPQAERSVQSVVSRPELSAPTAASNNQTPSQPKPLQDSGLFDKLSTALATSVLPVISHFFLDSINAPNPINHDLPMSGLTALVLMIGILDLFLCWLRKSGYRGAARSDGLPAHLTFATPIKVSFSWDNPKRNSLFSGLKIKIPQSYRKEVNYQ